MATTVRDPVVQTLLSDVAKAAFDTGHKEPVEMPVHYVEVAALFDRCRSTFGAIRLLVERDDPPDYGQEAIVLLRSMFTESLMLMELVEASDKRRVGLIMGRAVDGVNSLIGVAIEAQSKRKGASNDVAALEARRGQYQDYARRHGVTRLRPWRPTEKQLAEKHGRDDYLSFLISHHFVHGSLLATAQRYSVTDGNEALVGGPAASTEWGVGAALMAASCLVYAAEATVTILGLVRPGSLDRLQDRIEALDDQIESEQDPTEAPEPAAATTPEGPPAVPLRLSWERADDEPHVMVNQMLLRTAAEDELSLTFGQVIPPHFEGTPDERVAQAQRLDAVPIRVVARVAMTRQRLQELALLLQRYLNRSPR